MTSLRSLSFKEQGYLVIEDFATSLECDRLCAQMEELLKGCQTTGPIFSTQNRQQEKSEQFFRSARGIEFFFEEEAFDSQGHLAYPKEKAINKVGHALHQKDPVFRDFSWDKRFYALARELKGMAKPHIIQSMYIFKQAGIGGEVSCHQDATFLDTNPTSVTGFWLALEDAHEDNGCLWGVPYHGEKEALRQLFVCSNKNETHFEELDETPFAMEKLIPLSVKKGTLVALDGHFPHLSYANRSSSTRHAYSLHLVDQALPYPSYNWLNFDPQNYWHTT